MGAYFWSSTITTYVCPVSIGWIPRDFSLLRPVSDDRSYSHSAELLDGLFCRTIEV
jgi:hypothetical protein